ncbi:MAG TPA: carboxypeptidase regulatory-like domain-containing protein [Bacteroidaceae bacterium]|nr:carboxypeptidase regulatory-like domain-containing protein [Bacteroidaceae bacterium]
MKKIIALLTLICLPVMLMAAKIGGITGVVVERQSQEPIAGVQITLLSTPQQEATTDNEGRFVFESVPYGFYQLRVSHADYQVVMIGVKVQEPMHDMEKLSLVAKNTGNRDIDELNFASNAGLDEGEGATGTVALTATQDVYDNIASYDFSAMRFRSRGLDGGTQDVFVNGIRMNDAMTGYGPWSLYGGLNEAARSKEGVSRLHTSEYGVSGVNGATNINMRASMIRKGWRFSAVNGNGSYAARLMATYGSGNLDNGWSYAMSVSTRQGGNAYVNETDYNAYSYFLSVEKQLDDKHALGFSFWAAPYERGAQMATTQEVYDLVGDNYYNSNWGYQDGEKRNARVKRSHQPIATLNYYFTPDENTTFTAAMSYRFGWSASSALDWYDAQDPRPDYYKNLPSYLNFRGETTKAATLTEAWKDGNSGIQHLNWDRMYQVNRESDQDWGNYNGVDMGPGRSKYIVSDRHTDQRDFNLNLALAHVVDDHFEVNAGLSTRYNRTEYYNEVKDLLGGKYWVNIDNFAERDFSNADFETLMNDAGNLNNLVVHEGDKYGYDYYGNDLSSKLWVDLKYNVGPWNTFLAGEAGYSSIWRDGQYCKGLFQDNSVGNSTKKRFYTYRVKAGAKYQLGLNQSLEATVAYLNDAPLFKNAMISPRTRNEYVPHLTTEKTFSADLTYTAKYPWMDLRVSAYYMLMKDKSRLISFYDDLQNSFTNFAMSGIDQQHMGVELGVEVPIVHGLSVSGAMSLGDYVYTSTPSFTQTRDNTASVIQKDEKVYWKGFKVENTPQLATSLGLNYHTDSYWFFGLDAGYYGNSYLSMNPLLRTDFAIAGLTDEQALNMRSQEKLGSAFLLNADLGKSWYIDRKYNIGFSLQVKNLLNRQNIKTGGYEQMRLSDVDDADGNFQHYAPFDSKYYYLYGTTYYFNLYFRF